jgi:hypothetical protein
MMSLSDCFMGNLLSASFQLKRPLIQRFYERRPNPMSLFDGNNFRSENCQTQDTFLLQWFAFSCMLSKPQTTSLIIIGCWETRNPELSVDRCWKRERHYKTEKAIRITDTRRVTYFRQPGVLIHHQHSWIYHLIHTESVGICDWDGSFANGFYFPC